MEKGQTTPYLDMVRGKVPNARIEIIPDTGHFPQLDESAATTALLAEFARKFV
jgi:pimeloyl-ACP methyl ester carboxylesterase